MKTLKRRSPISFLTVLLLPLIVMGCTTRQPHYASANVVTSLSGVADEAFARAYEPIPLTFPQDHGVHSEYKTEWWYYTGNLIDEAGTQYGYQLTFFRSALTPDAPERASALATNQLYLAHFALTDGNAQRHDSFERYSRGAGDLAGATGEPRVNIWLEDWSVHETETGVSRLQASVENAEGRFALDLTLRETLPPLLHGDQGLSQKGPEAGNASYYYSLVGLESSGSFTSAGRTVAVTGRSWMDHEFGTSALSGNAVGWDWFSVQLDNGAVLVFAQVRTDDGGIVPNFTGTYVPAEGDGTQQTITADDVIVTATNTWASPDTGIIYPSGWQITFPEFDIELMIEPLVLDQEMDVSLVYWEGAVNIVGTLAGTPVQGAGYVELTGYGQSASSYQR